MDRERHIRILAWLWVVRGVLLAFGAVVVFIASFVGGIFSGSIVGTFVTPLIGLLVGFVLFLFALPSLAVGMGLLDGKPWARVLAMVLGVFAFFDIPLGMAICIYTFWTLWSRDADYYFEGRRPANYNYERN